mgnify:CR=1 FL=1
MNLEVLKKQNESVLIWAKEKGILDKGTPMAQAQKTIEEVIELKVAHLTNNKPDIKKIDPFILGLFIVIILAWLLPGLGDFDTWYSLDKLSNIGISLIFFFYGLKLSPKQMMEGLSNFRLHILVQLSTFLIFPLIILAIKPFFTINVLFAFTVLSFVF